MNLIIPEEERKVEEGTIVNEDLCMIEDAKFFPEAVEEGDEND